MPKTSSILAAVLVKHQHRLITGRRHTYKRLRHIYCVTITPCRYNIRISRNHSGCVTTSCSLRSGLSSVCTAITAADLGFEKGKWTNP